MFIASPKDKAMYRSPYTQPNPRTRSTQRQIKPMEVTVASLFRQLVSRRKHSEAHFVFDSTSWAQDMLDRPVYKNALVQTNIY